MRRERGERGDCRMSRKSERERGKNSVYKERRIDEYGERVWEEREGEREGRDREGERGRERERERARREGSVRERDGESV